MSYVGKFAESGSQNSFYKLVGKPYGFKSFPNKSLATFAHAVQSHLSPYSAPKVYSPVSRIRVPNYFIVKDKKGNMITKTELVLSNWGYLTEIAKPYRCTTWDCDGDCSSCEACKNYYSIQSLIDELYNCGIDYIDAHENNLGYVVRNKRRVLVPIDFGRESLNPIDELDWPEVCWDGAEDMYCECYVCASKYQEPEYA